MLKWKEHENGLEEKGRKEIIGPLEQMLEETYTNDKRNK